MYFKRVVWSPCEVEYLSKNWEAHSINQLCIALAKTKSAIYKKAAELDKTGVKKVTTKTTGHIKSNIGKRSDLNNIFLRSSWEANCYRVFKQDPTIVLIEYEPTTFSFAPFGILKGTVSYTPDFRITLVDGTSRYVEVKGGFMRRVDKTKITRFRKYFPEEFARLVAITPKAGSKTATFFEQTGVKIWAYYPDWNKKYRNVIPHWE